jgi:hypothetical protein
LRIACHRSGNPRVEASGSAIRRRPASLLRITTQSLGAAMTGSLRADAHACHFMHRSEPWKSSAMHSQPSLGRTNPLRRRP